MKIKGFRVELVAIIVIISLAIIFSLHYYWTNYYQQDTLVEQLSKLRVVEEIEIEKLEQSQMVKLKLAEINNLQRAYLKIDRVLKSSAIEEYSIELENPEDDRLLSAYQKLELSLYEVLMTGRFSTLSDRLQRVKEEFNLAKAELRVDEHFIYLLLDTGEDQFYKVINRSNDVSSTAKQGGRVDG
ncbi:MAG: hypothetical protein ACQEQI_06675 [Bacillota bacterium]